MPSASASSYAIARGELGASRLELLTQLTWPYTLRFLRKQIPFEGKHCLEPGCGTGIISAHLMELLGDEGRLTAFDIDPASIAQAQQNIPDPRAEFNIQNLSENNPVACEQYDIIFCRFILAHIPDPVDTIHRLRKSLRPGGLLIAEDIDSSGYFCCPDNTYFYQFTELVGAAINVRGGDPRLGTRLPAIFQAAGFTGLDIEVINHASLNEDVKRFSLFTLDAIRDTAIGEELLSEKEFLNLREGLIDFCNDPQALLSVARFIQCAGRKPYK